MQQEELMLDWKATLSHEKTELFLQIRFDSIGSMADAFITLKSKRTARAPENSWPKMSKNTAVFKRWMARKFVIVLHCIH